MSTLQHNPMNNLSSPVLLSPSSTTITTNHMSLFDNSDQGSVDSDYTSLGSSKFYGNSGSTSSLHRQGRSQSIDELASTTTIPTRHFNGISNFNKLNNDPLQFVKIHPNHDLIERAQEQLLLVESRKRLEEKYKLKNKINDEENDWSKAVENWRHKREQKRVKTINSNPMEDDRPASPFKIESILKSEETTKKLINESVPKPIRSVPSPPTVRFQSKSPSPLRNKGPSKLREISIEKPVDIRGFGFKLDGGRTQNRPIFISTIEEGSPADKAGLYIDDEVISMNDENIENMTFDQVRKILKERNLRGSIKMVVRTYEDLLDDNSQTVISAPTTDHSRTPSPQKSTTTTTVPSISHPINTQSSIFSPSSNPIKSPVPQQTSPSSLNIFAPKPYRTIIDTSNHPEPELTFSRKELLTLMTTNYSSPIEAFRKMLTEKSESIYDKELQDLEAEFEKQLRGIDETQKRETTTTSEKQQTTIPPLPPRVVANTNQVVIDQPPKLSPIDSSLRANSNMETRNDSPMAQVRSYVEKQMDQLQQDLEFGFSRTSKTPLSSTPLTPTSTREQQRPVTIPVESTTTTNVSLPPSQDLPRSSLKKSSSTQQELDRIPSNRTYGLKINPNEQVIHYLDPYTQQTSSSSYAKHSIPDLTTINRPSTTHTIERTFNELRINMPTTYSSQPQITNQQQQKKVTIQLGAKTPPQRISSKQIHTTLNQAPRKTHFEDHTWINHHQKNGRRSAPLAQHQQMNNYHPHSKNGQHRTRSPQNRATINNNRILSVSGKLRCSRCDDELGHGSAMVIESLGLYYHIECFRCFVCNIPLSSSFEGTDVRVRNHRLHCQNCFSDENGVKLSAV